MAGGGWIGWFCGLVGLACGGAVPDVALLQSAYERESAVVGAAHDRELQIVGADCSRQERDRFVCEVRFVSKADPAERLYFDVIGVERGKDGFALKSGLCKR